MTTNRLVWSFLLALAAACSGTSSGVTPPPVQTGQSCSQASQCFATLDGAALRGTATCLTQLQGGYCTHTCQSDADCCAVPGECPTGVEQVCAPFENMSATYCFLNCAASAIPAAADGGTLDPTTFCQLWGNASFTCRSTGGGSANRKFCGP